MLYFEIYRLCAAGTTHHRISAGEIAMSVYENQIQVPAKYYDTEMREIEQNDGEEISPVVLGSDEHVYEWADVLKDLEPYY